MRNGDWRKPLYVQAGGYTPLDAKPRQLESRRNRASIKRATLIVGAIALTALAACGGSSSSASNSSSPAAKKLTIGYIMTGPLDYYTRGAEGATAAESSLNVKVKVFNSDSKPEKEIANVEDAISQNVDGLIIFSVGKSSLQADLAKANAAHIPAVVLYGYDKSIESQAVTFIQAVTSVTSNEAGTWTAENVKSGNAAIIQGLLGRGDVESYTDGYKAGLAKNPNVKLVATVSAEWDRAKAQSSMADILTAHPNLSTVFVMNEDMALGAIAAIKAAGKQSQVVVVSQNGSPPGLQALAAGDLAATVSWSPAEESQMALVRLVHFIRTGQRPTPTVCNTPTQVITKNNGNSAVPWVPTVESTKVGLEASCAKG